MNEERSCHALFLMNLGCCCINAYEGPYPVTGTAPEEGSFPGPFQPSAPSSSLFPLCPRDLGHLRLDATSHYEREKANPLRKRMSRSGIQQSDPSYPLWRIKANSKLQNLQESKTLNRANNKLPNKCRLSSLAELSHQPRWEER